MSTGETPYSTPPVNSIQPGMEPLPGLEVEPPLPVSPELQNIAESVPLPTNSVQLEDPFTQYDMIGMNSGLFTTQGINDFAIRPVYLTGNWSLKFHLNIDTLYDGNIFLRSQNVKGDLITVVSPGVTMRLGNTESMFYLVADYTAGVNIYTQHPKNTTVDNDFWTNLQWNLNKTTITMRAGVFADTGQDVDVTDLVQREFYYADVDAHYQYSDKTSFDVATDYERWDFNGLISSSQIDGQLFANYNFSPKTQAGIGASVGYLDVPGGSNQTFEAANLRLADQVTGKLSVVAQVGAQFRQYDRNEGDSVTPVFSIEGTWQARPGTRIDLNLQRAIYASAILYDQDYAATSVNATLTQRITDYVSVALGAGYVNTDYQAAASGVTAAREDNYFYVQPSVSWRALTWLSIGVFYQYSQDFSHGGIGVNNFRRDAGGVDFAFNF